VPFAVEIGHLDAALRRIRPIKMLINPVDSQSFGVDCPTLAAQHHASITQQPESLLQLAPSPVYRHQISNLTTRAPLGLN